MTDNPNPFFCSQNQKPVSQFKIARVSAGLQQRDLAQATGLSESQISKIETGRLMPSPILKQRLADLLHKKTFEVFQ